MPEPDFPPTPAASTDLAAQKTGLQTSPGPHFILPPPAMNKSNNGNTSNGESAIRTSTSESSETSASSYRPASPISPVPKAKSGSPRHKRTSSGAVKPVKDDFDLPPPPSRSRKIIHVQPKSQTLGEPSTSTKSPSSTSPTSKRKQPSATSAAGRKMARRTAHSIIERRRRSKMNEEFDTLKNMIPACEGQEMHKLAILQAGVEYLRYLEDCVKDLKGRNNDKSADGQDIRMRDPPQFRRPSTAASSVSASPALPPSGGTMASSRASTSGSTAATPTLLTPAFNAIQFSPEMPRQAYATASATPSPNILPQSAVHPDNDLDQDHHDATTALLMLTNDRRGIGSRDGEEDALEEGESTPKKKRIGGMSVRDLLST